MQPNPMKENGNPPPASRPPDHSAEKSRRARLLLVFVVVGVGLIWTFGASATEIQPRNGHWQAVMEFQSVSGCSAKMRREIEADAEDETLYSKPLAFPTPLDLNGLNEEWDVDITWSQAGPNQWQGVMTETERTLFGKIVSTTEITTFVASETAIDQSVVTTLTLPPLMARRMGSKTPCSINSNITHRRTGS